MPAWDTLRQEVIGKESVSRPVSRVLYGPPPEERTWRPFFLGIRCRMPHATYPDDWDWKPPRLSPRHPYSVLLPVWFAVPSALLRPRWALTPPFHPCPAAACAACSAQRVAGRFAFCGTFPGVAPAGRYPAPCFRGARTFLTCGLSARAGAAARPADGPGIDLQASAGKRKPAGDRLRRAVPAQNCLTGRP